jgi:hypothetical protein
MFYQHVYKIMSIRLGSFMFGVMFGVYLHQEYPKEVDDICPSMKEFVVHFPQILIRSLSDYSRSTFPKDDKIE